jgi:DNA-binding IclR family transcriptional regulator
MGSKAPAHCPALERALAILEILDVAQGGKSVSEIIRRMGIPKSSAHVLMSTLRHLGYVTYNSDLRAYKLGLKAYALGKGLVSAMELSTRAHPYLAKLSERTGMTTSICVLDGEQALYTVVCLGSNGAQSGIYAGKRVELHCTAAGKVLLAHMRERWLQDFLNKHRAFLQHTQNTITSPKTLCAELKTIRELGYAMDREEYELGVCCLAVPLPYDFARPVAALGIKGTKQQMEGGHVRLLSSRLKQVAAKICHPPGS